MGKTSKIIFLRHGITEGNEKNWYYGTTDLPLSEAGKKEVAAIRERNPYPQEDGWKYFTSGLRRADETMRGLFGDRDFETIEDLQEMKFGEFECRSYEELKDEEDFQEWMNDTTWEVAPKGGESRNEFKRRIENGLDELLASHNEGGEPVSVIVTHGGVIASLIHLLFEPKDKNWWELIPEPASGFVVHLEGGTLVGYEPIDNRFVPGETKIEI